jgi:hypothetical protein
MNVNNINDNNIYKNDGIKAHLEPTDKTMFLKYLDKCNGIYFEYGSGGSTWEASKRKNISQIFSVESDITWIEKLVDKIKSTKTYFIHNNMGTLPGMWGEPGKDATFKQKMNYSDALGITKLNPSLVFIGGRFRVACCLKAWDIIDDNCIVLFDNFVGRKCYLIILNYFKIVDRTSENMVALKKRKDCESPNVEAYRYSLDSR